MSKRHRLWSMGALLLLVLGGVAAPARAQDPIDLSCGVSSGGPQVSTSPNGERRITASATYSCTNAHAEIAVTACLLPPLPRLLEPPPCNGNVRADASTVSVNVAAQCLPGVWLAYVAGESTTGAPASAVFGPRIVITECTPPGTPP